MAMKTANQDVYFRIKSAASLLAAGVRLNKPEMEARGRSAYALAFIENAILVHSEHLTSESRAFLARLLFDTQQNPDSTNADDDATADAEETAQELQSEAHKLRSAKTPFDLIPPSELPPETLYDPNNEFEEEEEDYTD